MVKHVLLNATNHVLYFIPFHTNSAACALVYLILGCFCFDRFTSRAFLSQKDPITSTSIPQGGTDVIQGGAAGGNYDPPVSA